MDTIFALSSGSLPCGIAVVRISGERSRFALETVAGQLPEPRFLSLRPIRLPGTAEIVDRGVVCWFAGPDSFTGEDCAEIHLHGGPALLRAMLGALSAIDGMRMAEAGEFSRRAFENGKIDLTGVEGLVDLIAAETEAQRKLAFGQFDGALRRRAENWRREIVRLRAMVEAALDFAEEEDVPDVVSPQLWRDARAVADEVDAVLESANAGEVVRRGFQIVLMGRPNAGKSSLLNALARRDVAIVTDEAGTTRDILEVRLDLGGYPATIVDTAGIREAHGQVEREGVRRARLRSRSADLVVWLAPVDEPEEAPQVDPDVPMLVLRSKDDAGAFGDEGVSVCRKGGLAALERRLQARVRDTVGRPEEAIVSRERQRLLLEETRELLRRAAGETEGLELAAEHLRGAGDALGRLTGRIDVEDLLDVIFSEFCIGK